MFKYNVTFNNGASSVVNSTHEITGMPKQRQGSIRQHYKIVIPAYTNHDETIYPYGTFDPYYFVLQLIQSDQYWSDFLENVDVHSPETRFINKLNFGPSSMSHIIDFWQKEGCDIDAADSRAEEILQLVGDKIVEEAKAAGGTTFFYEKLWNYIYCVSQNNVWQYQEHQEELLYAQFDAFCSVSGMTPLYEEQFRDYINRFNKHVGGPEPDFSQASWYSASPDSEWQYGPVFVGQSFIDAAAYGGMTNYFQDDPTYYYQFNVFF